MAYTNCLHSEQFLGKLILSFTSSTRTSPKNIHSLFNFYCGLPILNFMTIHSVIPKQRKLKTSRTRLPLYLYIPCSHPTNESPISYNFSEITSSSTPILPLCRQTRYLARSFLVTIPITCDRNTLHNTNNSNSST